MPTIMFTSRLWKSVGGRGPLSKRSETSADPARLRVWAAKRIDVLGEPFVVALEEVTYLSMLAPLLPLPGFYRAFAASFATQLGKASIPRETIVQEVEAFLAHPRPAKNDDRGLLGSLNDVAFHAGVRLEHERSFDLATVERVQEELNRIPHVKREPAFPDQAVRLFFNSAGSA